ncbi:MAG: hypothetical protein AB7S26_36805 [Sandaracinaceae bacterium]
MFERILTWPDLLGTGGGLGFSPRATIGLRLAELRALLGDRLLELRPMAGVDHGGIDVPPIELAVPGSHLSFSVLRDRVYGASIVVDLPDRETDAAFEAAVRAELGEPVASPTPTRTFYGGDPCVEVNRMTHQAEIWFGSRRISRDTGETPACGDIGP